MIDEETLRRIVREELAAIRRNEPRKAARPKRRLRQPSEVRPGRAEGVARWVEVLSRLGGDVTTRAVAAAGGIAPDRIDHGTATRIGEALRRAGWRVAWRHGTGLRERVYRREVTAG